MFSERLAARLVRALLTAALKRSPRESYSTFDSDRQPGATPGAGGALSDLRLVLASRRLTALAIVGWSYGVLQFCLFTFFVTMAVTELGWGLVAAGGMATVMQVGGVTGRIAGVLLPIC